MPKLAKRTRDFERYVAACTYPGVIDPGAVQCHLRDYVPVHPELRPMLGGDELGEPQELTARNAIASTFGKRGEVYRPEWQA